MTPAQHALRALLREHDAQSVNVYGWLHERNHTKQREILMEALKRVEAAEGEARRWKRASEWLISR